MSTSISGRKLGGYDVGPLIGSGGMGEVYRARDTKLNRDVAIKTLLSAVAKDAERLARFRREAQVLAALNHPNIAQIHGLEEADAGPFLVMELVEGPTLADRIAQGPIPLDESLAIARQIAEALAAAHERGIIHRDLKPANVKVRDEGTVKVLDFGLAKAMDPIDAVSASAAAQPTITTPAMTGVGMIMGTAAYMSPEQAKGRVVDKRSDVWAFGCVLYEMLTGRRAFDGEDVTDTIAAVVRAEPDWSALPAEAPPQIRLLLKRCLEKDRRARVSDIGVALFLMTETLPSVAPREGSAAAAAPAVPRRRLAGAAVLGLVAGVVLIAGAAWGVGALAPTPAAKPARFTVVPPPAQPLAIQGGDHDVAISPDGSLIVYRAGSTSLIGQVELAVRTLNDLEPRLLAGTIGARHPFVSPDGQWVGFFLPTELRKVSITGGPSVLICKVVASPRGASWDSDDQIVFALPGRGLLRVSAQGGEPVQLTSPETAKGEFHTFPFAVPGARAVIFTNGGAGPVESAHIDVLDETTGRIKTLVKGGQDAITTNNGYLVYGVTGSGGAVERSAGSLRAIRFDAKRLEVSGDSIPVVENVLNMPTGAADFALSRDGTLVYVNGDPRLIPQTRPRALVWVNRQGKEESIHAPERSYATARLSPDGTRVALDVREQTNDIWIWDLKRETLTPLNRDPGQDMSPVWTPDGLRILWATTRGGGNPNLYWQAADGTGSIDRLTTEGGAEFPTSMSPDGSQAIIFASLSPSTGYNVYAVRLKGSDSKAEPLVQTPGLDFGGEISPDGQWLAYHSNESGEFQVYVRPYPKVDSGRYPISTGGGTRPAWARNGRELFYLDAAGLLTSVKVQASATTFSAGAPVKILSSRYYAGSTSRGLDLRGYDVSPDGQRFLMIKEGESPDQRPEASAGLVVVVNWFEELKARLPIK